MKPDVRVTLVIPSELDEEGLLGLEKAVDGIQRLMDRRRPSPRSDRDEDDEYFTFGVQVLETPSAPQEVE